MNVRNVVTKENIEKGIPAELETLKKEIAERDYKDSHRSRVTF